jgi:glycosyltransferase involved in cell wall biosynthesis
VRIAYCTNVRLPTERAHGHQVAQVCDALTTLGHEVHIFVPFRKNPVTQDLASYYGISPAIQLHTLGTFDPIASVLPGVSKLWVLNALLRRELKRALPGKSFDLVYTRSPALLPVLENIGLPVILELHQTPRLGRRAFVKRCNRCALVACLTSLMRDELVRLGVDASRIVVAPDGVDGALFGKERDAVKAKEKFGMDPAVPVIGYAGQLESMGRSKGIPELLRAAEVLAKEGMKFQLCIVGGPEAVQRRFEDGLSMVLKPYVHFIGFQKREDMPVFLAACDILVYPAPNSMHPYYQRDTSPLKVFEYLLAGRPIVAAALPPLRDVLDANIAWLVKPGDDQEMAAALREILDQPEVAAKKAVAAKRYGARYTWDLRMRNVLEAASLRRP